MARMETDCNLKKKWAKFFKFNSCVPSLDWTFFLFRDFRLPLLDILEKSWMIGYYAQISSGLAKFTSHCLSYSLVFLRQSLPM